MLNIITREQNEGVPRKRSAGSVHYSTAIGMSNASSFRDFDHDAIRFCWYRSFVRCNLELNQHCWSKFSLHSLFTVIQKKKFSDEQGRLRDVRKRALWKSLLWELQYICLRDLNSYSRNDLSTKPRSPSTFSVCQTRILVHVRDRSAHSAFLRQRRESLHSLFRSQGKLQLHPQYPCFVLAGQRSLGLKICWAAREEPC